MNDLQLIEMVAETDAYAPQTPLPSSTWSREYALHEIERRAGMDTRDTTNSKATPPGVTQQIEPSPSPKATERLVEKEARRRWSGGLVGVAAFAVVVIVVGAVILLSGGGDEVAPATPSTTQAPVTAPPFSGDEALAVTDAYFEAYNAGNIGAVASLFSPDVTIQWFGDVSQSEFEMITAFYAGQGTTLTPPDCSVTDQVPGESATVSCDFDTLTGLTQAVGGPLIPTQFTADVTLDGIRNLFFFYRGITFLHVGAPFTRWMEEHNPENAAEVEFGNWTTVDEARETGLLTAQFADEWAAYLDANGCTYNDTDCPSFTVDEALAVKDAYIAAYNAGDADAVLALFAPDPTISGLGALSLVTFERRLAWKIAQGTTATASECTANELEDAVSLLCGFTNHQYSAVAVGAPPVEGNLTLIVSREGIRNHSEGLDPRDFDVVNSPFERWLEENHPEDISIVLCCGSWDSVAQAEQGGILHARYADEWAAYLEANGCTYTDTDC